MRGWLSMLGYRLRVWLARRWADPQLAWLAEQYGSVIVTAERHGKVILPIYQVHDYDMTGRLAWELYRTRRERDLWKLEAERRA